MTWIAFVFYVVFAIVMTWPVVTGMTRHLPADLLDPAFVTFLIAWGSKHWLELLSGDLSAAVRFWNAPIYYPETLTTGYSEHFALHSLLTLPIYALTHNAILCYNLWFIASYALAGFFMFLLARAMTGHTAASFVAGLAFAFAPYRFAVLPHLQVLSAFWMPLTLLGIHRYFETGRWRSLVLAGAALVAQSLASGYYLVFFGPFVGVFAIVEMAVRKRLADVRAWIALAVTAVATFAATVPFASVYLTLQKRFNNYKRPFEHSAQYSADLAAWLTASPDLHLWGWLRTFDKPEGWLFPGLTTVLLAIAGVVIAARRARAPEAAARTNARIVLAFAAAAILLSSWIALGPIPTLMGKPVAVPAVFRVLYAYVPGYDIARVPARITMVGILATSLLAAIALAAVDRRRWILIVAGAGICADAAMMPLPRDGVATSDPTVRPPDRLYAEREAPRVYHYLKTLPQDAVIAELPFGLIEREIQYTYYSAIHGRRLLNGYSGVFPMSWMNRIEELRRPSRAFGTMYSRLEMDGATHVVVHTGAWLDDTGKRAVEIFEGTGFPRLARFGDDYVFLLKLQK
jgi:hypothetical protein